VEMFNLLQDRVGHAAGERVAGHQQEREPVGVGAPNRKLGRNDLCWCGSGRKYKRCHGR